MCSKMSREQLELILTKNFFKRLQRVTLVMAKSSLPAACHQQCVVCDYYEKSLLSERMCQRCLSADITCPICSETFETDHLGCSEQKLYLHMDHGKSHKLLQKYITWLKDNQMQCPVCNKVFEAGYYHLASQKLYSSLLGLSNGKSHRSWRNEMEWPERHLWDSLA